MTPLLPSVAALIVAIVCAAIVALQRRRTSRKEKAVTEYVESVAEMLECARTFALAARDSATAVYRELDKAMRARVPGIDSLAVFVQVAGRLTCVYGTPGSRIERYAGRAEYSVTGSDDVAPIVALQKRQVVTSDDGATSIHPGCRFAAAIPLMLDHGNTSVVYVSGLQPFAEALPAVEMLIEQAEPAMLLANERDELEGRATFDSLTGLLLKSPFHRRVRDEIEQCARTGSTVTLLFIDADHFKEWNDTFGHHSGDQLLQRIAGLILDARISGRDLAGRLGGDEFCIALLDVDKAEALRAAEDLGKAIRYDNRSSLIPLEIENPPDVPVSASIGVAAYPRDAASYDELLFRADQIMYEAKHGGRNRVCYVGDDNAVHAIPTSDDRRDDATRPYSDRRATGRDFIPAEAS